MRELIETYFQIMLNSLGYNSAELGYSFSYSQGDGACFYNCEIDLEKVIFEIDLLINELLEHKKRINNDIAKIKSGEVDLEKQAQKRLFENTSTK